MTTARDIIAAAYQRLGLLPLGADLDPDRAAAGLATYNDMLNAWAADGIFPGGPYPPIQQTDGFYANGGFIDGSIEITGGAYPPYGPSDTSTPPGGLRSLLRSGRRFPVRSSVRGGGQGAARRGTRAAKRNRTAALAPEAGAKGSRCPASLLRDRPERRPGHRRHLDAKPAAIRVSVAPLSWPPLIPGSSPRTWGGHPARNSLVSISVWMAGSSPAVTQHRRSNHGRS